MIGVVSHDFFTELSNTEMEEGIAREQRDQMLQVNSYTRILVRIPLLIARKFMIFFEYDRSSDMIYTFTTS